MVGAISPSFAFFWFDILESHNLEGLWKSYFHVNERFLRASPSNLSKTFFFYNDTCPYTDRSKIQEVEEEGIDINWAIQSSSVLPEDSS